MDKTVSQYLVEIGRKGGKKSRRNLAPETARNMVKVREARPRHYYTSCFWPFDPTYQITMGDISCRKAPTVRYGNDEALSGRYKLLKEEVEVTDVLELVAPLNGLCSH